MDTFKVTQVGMKPSDTRSRSVRLNIATYERLMELSTLSGESFNKIVNQALEYALQHLEIIGTDEEKQ